VKRFYLAISLVISWLVAPSVSDPAMATSSPVHFVVTGSGYGHGVGMSQIGAEGQALEGLTATEILNYWFPGTTVIPASINQNIKVNIGHAMSSGSFTLKSVDTSTAWSVGTQSLPINSTVKFSISGKSIVLALITPKQAAMTLSSKSPWTLNFTGLLTTNIQGKVMNLRYGSIGLKLVGSKIEVTDTMSIDQYVLGISEVSSSWPTAALQAQAIASRTYGLAHSTLRTACDCNVYSSNYDQVYVGYAKESEPTYGQFWSAAVTATQTDTNNALAITYQGKPISVFFFASDGGVTQSAAEVWGSGQPYLTNVKDPWSLDIFLNPYYAHWQRVISQTDMAAAFALPDVAIASITSRALSNAATVITATSSTGETASLSVGDLKSKLRLPSSWFEIAPPGY
jgi:SpoIID/LytB domain protein